MAADPSDEDDREEAELRALHDALAYFAAKG
jgi:hypothetical protein